MEPHASDSIYFNVSMEEVGDDATRAAFGENDDRRVEVKTEYDPENLFRVNQNTEPAR